MEKCEKYKKKKKSRVKTLQGEREREKESRGGGRKGITWNGTLIPYEGALTSNYFQSVGGGEDGGEGEVAVQTGCFIFNTK